MSEVKPDGDWNGWGFNVQALKISKVGDHFETNNDNIHWIIEPYKGGWKWFSKDGNIEVYRKSKNLTANDNVHRIDGPAYIVRSSVAETYVEYYIDGKKLTKNEFNALVAKFNNNKDLETALDLTKI